MVTISLLTFTRNSAKGLRRLLGQVAHLVDEIVVVDGYSTDETIEVAKSYGAKVFWRKPWGYADPDRMFGLRKVSSDWVLYLDSDEILCPRLAENLRALIEDAEKDGVDALAVQRVEFDEKLRPLFTSIQIRIYKRDRVMYRGLVHELPVVLGKTNALPSEFYIAHLDVKYNIRKLIFYARLEALEYLKKESRSLIRKGLWKLQPLMAPMLILSRIVLAGKRKTLLSVASLKAFGYLGLYETMVHLLMKLRGRKQKRIARLLQHHGLIQLLRLDEEYEKHG